MQIRNDKNRTSKQPEIGDVIYISIVKYVVYAITEKSIKLESPDERIPTGFRRKDHYNKNTFSKRYFFDKVKLYWRGLTISRVPNMDYM